MRRFLLIGVLALACLRSPRRRRRCRQRRDDPRRRPQGLPHRAGEGPKRGSTTHAGGDALAEVAAAGVNFLKVGPETERGRAPTSRTRSRGTGEAAASAGSTRGVNLATLARARPSPSRAALLRKVIGSLERDPSATALGMWKGADGWRYRTTIPSPRFAYCLATSRATGAGARRRPADLRLPPGDGSACSADQAPSSRDTAA